MIIASESYLKLSCFQVRNRRLVGDWDEGTVGSEQPHRTVLSLLCPLPSDRLGPRHSHARGLLPFHPRAIPKASVTWNVQGQSLNALNAPASMNWQRFGSFNALFWSRSGQMKDSRRTGYCRQQRERQPLVNQFEIQSETRHTEEPPSCVANGWR